MFYKQDTLQGQTPHNRVSDIPFLPSSWLQNIYLVRLITFVHVKPCKEQHFNINNFFENLAPTYIENLAKGPLILCWIIAILYLLNVKKSWQSLVVSHYLIYPIGVYKNLYILYLIHNKILLGKIPLISQEIVLLTSWLF